MHNKESPECAKCRRPLRSYSARVFQESSVGVLSNIAQADSFGRRILKVVLLIICLMGFMYQSGRFLLSYLQYPTVMNVDIKRHLNLMVPAYTFCDNNGMKRSIYCEKFPERCEKADEEFCEKYGSYCGINRTLVPKKEYYISYVPQEELIYFNSRLNDFFENRHPGLHNENVTGPYLRLKKIGYPHLMLCYTWNSRVDNQLEIIIKKKPIIIEQPENIFIFDVEEDEIFIPGDEAGILFAIHSPFDAVNPFETGIFLKPGRTYIVYVTMDMEILLKSPYSTDCIDYDMLLQEYNLTGPRTKRMCIDKCLHALSMLCFNCIYPLLVYPTKERLCEGDLRDIECNTSAVDLEDKVPEICQMRCKDSCTQIKYKYKVQERSSLKFYPDGKEIDNVDKKIFVDLFVDDSEVTVWSHSPKYMIVEVFSTIGGFVGIWLGISFLDVTDILDGVFRIFGHSLGRKR